MWLLINFGGLSFEFNRICNKKFANHGNPIIKQIVF